MTPIGATWTTDEVLRELGDRLRQYRLQQNRTVAAIARDAGVGVRTIVRLEAGEHPTLETVIQVLRALGRLEALEAMIPRPAVSPLQLVKLAGKERVRASGSRRKRALDATDG